MGKVFIYNKVQALFYINKYKCKVIDIDVHRKTLKPFVVFDKNETEEAYSEWCRMCEEHKKNNK